MLYNFEMQIHAKINLSQPFISEIMQMYFFLFLKSQNVLESLKSLKPFGPGFGANIFSSENLTEYTRLVLRVIFGKARQQK